jgi:hypothetical protein
VVGARGRGGGGRRREWRWGGEGGDRRVRMGLEVELAVQHDG